MSIKSVHITNYYHRNSGGISTAYDKLLEAANRHRRFVRLIVPGETGRIEEVGDFGRIYYIKAGFSPVFDKRYRVMLPWKTYIFDQSPIKKILRDEKPDIVEIGEKYTLSLMAGLLRKGIMNISPQRPMLVHFSCERMDDNVQSFIWRGRVPRRFSRGFIRNFVFPMFDFHLANSDFTAGELRDAVSSTSHPGQSNRFLKLCWRIFRTSTEKVDERIVVNQCGVDNKTFSISRKNPDIRRELISKHGLPENVKLLLYAGRISPEKNVVIFPKLMDILFRDAENDYRLLIAGAGPDSERLFNECERRAKGKVIMLGHIGDKEELANLFANCDVFVHPNPREPFGITPLEAMASGLPVIAPNSGGVLSYATDKNAWLAKPAAKDFAAAVRDVFSNDDRRNSKIEAARETAGSYSWEKSTDELFAIYDRMYSQFSRNGDKFDNNDTAKNAGQT